MLEASPPTKAQRSINATSLEDSLRIHKKRSSLTSSSSGGDGSSEGKIVHKKSIHNAKNGFLRKLTKDKARGSEQSSSTTLENQSSRTSFSTANLQRKCLVTVELLDPQTHTIIMQNEVSTIVFFVLFCFACVHTCGYMYHY